MSYRNLGPKALIEAKNIWEKVLVNHTPVKMEELVKQYLSTKSKDLGGSAATFLQNEYNLK